MVEVFKDALKPLGRVIRVEAVTGLAAGEEAGLGLHGGRHSGELDWPDMDGRGRGDGKVHGGELLRSNAAGESGFYRCLGAFSGKHFAECLADSVDHGTTGRQLPSIEREPIVKLGIELFARRERHIFEVHGKELCGRG